MKRTLALALLLVVALSPLRAQQSAGAAQTSIVLVDLNGHERSVGPSDLARLTRRDTLVSAHHVSGKFSGVLLSDVLSLAHAPAGDSLRGKALRTYVRIEGADRYSVILALAELDAGFADRVVILADRKDGAALAPKDGPYQLVVPGDKRPARWVRQVTRISLQRAP